MRTSIDANLQAMQEQLLCHPQHRLRRENRMFYLLSPLLLWGAVLAQKRKADDGRFDLV